MKVLVTCVALVVAIVLIASFFVLGMPEMKWQQNKSLNQQLNENDVLLTSGLRLDSHNENRFLVAPIEMHEAEGVLPTIRLFVVNEPKRGGVEWEELPTTEVLQLLKEKSSWQSLFVRMKCKLKAFSAPYQINPDVDPHAIAFDSSEVSFFLAEKIRFPPAGHVEGK